MSCPQQFVVIIYTKNTYHLSAAVKPLPSCSTLCESLRTKASLAQTLLRTWPHLPHVVVTKNCCAPDPHVCGVIKNISPCHILTFRKCYISFPHCLSLFVVTSRSPYCKSSSPCLKHYGKVYNPQQQFLNMHNKFNCNGSSISILVRVRPH